MPHQGDDRQGGEDASCRARELLGLLPQVQAEGPTTSAAVVAVG
jgi:hypothetical protein